MTIEVFGPHWAQIIRLIWFGSGVAYLLFDLRHNKFTLSSLLYIFFGSICWTMLGAARLFMLLFPSRAPVTPSRQLKFEFFVMALGMLPWAICGLIFTMHK